MEYISIGNKLQNEMSYELRHKNGVHYTSIENIHKVIDPLFLNDLKEELTNIVDESELISFQNKLSNIKILDPTCGVGNFLIESYLSLRKLENEVLFKLDNLNLTIKVKPSQFYGIELDEKVVNECYSVFSNIENESVNEVIDKLNVSYLKSKPNIIVGNSLRIDWNDIISNKELTYIAGNPPFLGYKFTDSEQKSDLLSCFGDKTKSIRKLDYVCSWFIKSAKYIDNSKVEVALVSTNSITQGEQVSMLWRELKKYDIRVNFAYKSFEWNNGSVDNASVYCVIIGFSQFDRSVKYLYSNDDILIVENINGYLIEGDGVLIESRTDPICNVPKINYGNEPRENGYLSKWSLDEMNEITNVYPESKKLFKKIIGAREFINNDKSRYCLWLDGIAPEEYDYIEPINDVLRKVEGFRLKSSRKSTRDCAKIPHLFQSIRQPDTNYMIIPLHSSKNRMYMPIGFVSNDIISTNANSMVEKVTLYEFGVLTSNVHMSWVNLTCGRLGESIRYSANIVYNNFPWCNPTDEQKSNIIKNAQKILDVRDKYNDKSLAELYDIDAMPDDLLLAHRENDKLIMELYGIDNMSNCINRLFELYNEIVG